MRPSQVRDAVIAVVAGLTPRTQSNRADRFAHASAVGAAPTQERAFTVEPEQPPGHSTGTGRPLHQARSMVVTLTLRIQWRQTEEARPRALDDCQQIVLALVSLKAAGHVQVIESTVTPAAMDPQGDMLAAIYSVAVEYDPRDP